VKDTLMASKKTVVTVKKEDLSVVPDPSLRTLVLAAVLMERTCEKFGVDAAEIRRFVDGLKKRGVLK